MGLTFKLKSEEAKGGLEGHGEREGGRERREEGPGSLEELGGDEVAGASHPGQALMQGCVSL